MKTIDLLILDDEQNILNSLKRLFRKIFYEIYVTTDYKEALEQVRVNNIKVVMSDQKMPDISGADFLKQVKDMKSDTVRILFTGYSDIKAAEDAINKGEVYRFINKPWDDSELKNIVAAAVEKFDLTYKNQELTESLQKKNEGIVFSKYKITRDV